MKTLGNVAVVGSGMAGLAAARVMREAGIAVTVFDKGRQPGGRLATRRVQDWVFNHGCQFFTVRDAGFAAAVHGVCALWPAAGEGRFAGVPDMAAVAGHLAAGLDVRQHAHVRSLARHQDGWVLRFDEGVEHQFDALVLAVPAPQAAVLLAGLHPAFEARLRPVHLAPCWAVMLGFDDAPPRTALEVQMNVPAWPLGIWASWQGSADSPVSWAVRETMRPDALPAPPAYTFHFSGAWSAAHLEDSPEDVIAAVLDGGWAFGGHKPSHAAAHRWRYALADKVLGEDCLWDENAKLGLCGDWCVGGRLEAAYLSGHRLGARMMR